MKGSLTDFEFWENFVMEKLVSEALSSFVGKYTIKEIMNNYEKSFDRIQEALQPILGWPITRDFFELKNIAAQIRVARNAFANLDTESGDVFVCGGDVYYYIIKESEDKKRIYLQYQWRSLFYELVTLFDENPREYGQAKVKLMEIIRQKFPRAERLMFRGDTEGTLKMFRTEPGFVEMTSQDPDAKYYLELRPLKKTKECITCCKNATFTTREYPGKYFCGERCLSQFLQ